jgi:hypothetical protein
MSARKRSRLARRLIDRALEQPFTPRGERRCRMAAADREAPAMTHWYVTDHQPPRIYDLDKSHGFFLYGDELCARFGTAHYEHDETYCPTIYEGRDAVAEMARVLAWLEGDGPSPCGEQRGDLLAETD